MNNPLESIHPQAAKAGEASLCAARQDIASFWAMHDLLFENTSEWSGKEDAVAIFKGYARQLDLDTAAFDTCLDGGETAADMRAQAQYSASEGVSGVPAFRINDWAVSGAQPYEVFQETIEKALQGQRPPPTPTPLPAGVSPFDVNPQQPNYTYTGDTTRGAADAKVVLLEFIDFASTNTLSYFQNMWPALVKSYVDAGKVRIIVKHFPGETEQANKAAEASECAGKQGAFWEMHDMLFAQQAKWAESSDAIALFNGYAAELKLDAAAFATCLAEGQTKSGIGEDVEIAQWNQLSPAPQFVLLQGEQGSIVPSQDLVAALDQLLAQ